MNRQLLNQPKYPIDSIIKAATVIDILGESDGELGVKNIADRLGLTPSTTHRILSTLASIGYIYHNPDTHRYRLGIGLFQRGIQALSQFGANPVIRHDLELLASKTGETAKLGIMFSEKLIYLGIAECASPLRFTEDVGGWAPLHCTAMGKLLLAYLPEDDIPATLNSLTPLKRMTPNTITDIEPLIRELEGIRQNGYATDNEEYLVGSRGFAVPVQNTQARVVAALSIAGPSARLSLSLAKSYLPTLQQAAEKVGGFFRLWCNPGWDKHSGISPASMMPNPYPGIIQCVYVIGIRPMNNRIGSWLSRKLQV